MNAKQLRYFIAVATEGTFTKASSKLRVAQPALSRQIGLLEEELSTPLLIRHRRGVFLTEAGNALMERARPLLVSFGPNPGRNHGLFRRADHALSRLDYRPP